MQKTYELTCLISANTEEAKKDKIVKKIDNLIREKGGEIINAVPPVAISLGYPICQQNKAEAAVFVFHCPKENLPNLKGELDKSKFILRCLLAQISLKKTAPPSKKTKTPRPQKVDLKDIDRKIEEIFNPKKQ